MDVTRALKRLEAELERIEEQPHKIEIDRPAHFTNVLAAELLDGTTGSKTIRYDKVTGHCHGIVYLRRPDGAEFMLDAEAVTVRRCALMALLVLRRLRAKRVGLVGFGKINRACKAMIDDWHDVGPIWTRDPASHKRMECDAILTATTNLGRPLIEVNDRRLRACHAISFDGDQTLGDSFRLLRTVLADHPSQLKAHWSSEFRTCERVRVEPLSRLNPDSLSTVHLYGIGAADLIVAEELIHEGHGHEHRRIALTRNDQGAGVVYH